MLGRSRDKVLHEARITGPLRQRRGSPWRPIALLALVALVAIGSREGFLPLDAHHWLSVFDSRQTIRAAVNVSSGRPDCRLLRVIDGDTVDLDCPGEGFLRARLLGFDTPEVVSPGCRSELARGTAATQALDRKISASREVRVHFRGWDRYGRRLARLSLDGMDVAEPMIAEGLARPYDGGRRRSWCG